MALHLGIGGRRHGFERLRAQMETERQSFVKTWRELADFIQPFRPRFVVSDSNRGDRRSKKIIDSTATLASRTLAAGMMAGVTSPARPWFKLTMNDQAVAQLGPVKSWLDLVTRRMTSMFLRTNLYQSLPLFYRDLAVFGTTAMVVEEDFDNVMRFFVLSPASFMISNNERLRPEVFMRVFRMTARQIVEKFGRPEMSDDPNRIDWSNISDVVRRLWENGQTEQWAEVVHVVIRNERFDPDKPESKFRRFASVYYERGVSAQQADYTSQIGPEKFLSQRGYDLFPVLAGRWEVSGEDVYATDCPGFTSIGDVRQLQTMEKRKLQAIEKMVNPPLKGPAELRNIPVSILPGGLTFTNEREGQRGLQPIHEVNPQLADLNLTEQQVRGRIRRAFFEDLFLMLATSDRRQITAREIEERSQEKLLAVGSVLEQLNQDVLDPLIDMAFLFMQRQDMIPEAPEEIQGQEMKVEYVSILSQAQKLTGLVGIDRFTGFLSGVAQLNPSALDKLNVDAIVNEYADITGIPPAVIIDDEEVEKIREAKARAAEAQQAAANASQAAEVAKTLSKSKTEEGNALGDLLAQAQAGAPTEAPI